MLAPRISLKQLLSGMVGVAIFLALVSLAYNGSMVAFGLSVSILILAVLFMGYAIVYGAFSLLLVWASKAELGKDASANPVPSSGESTGE